MKETEKCVLCGREWREEDEDNYFRWWECASCRDLVCKDCMYAEVEKPDNESFIVPPEVGGHDYTGDICRACYEIGIREGEWNS